MPLPNIYPSIQALYAAAEWNTQRALERLRWERFEKNHDTALRLLSEAGRFFRNRDHCLRVAFLMSHQKAR